VNTWKVILATMVIFAAGVLTGGILTRSVDRAMLLRRPHLVRPTQPSPGGLRLDFLRRVQRELDLDSDQREKIDRVLKESQERSRKIMEPISPQLRQEFQRAKDEFRAVLTAEQQTKFEDLLKKQSRSREHRPAASPAQSTPELQRTNF